MDISMAKEYGDKKIIRILNSIGDTDKTDFWVRFLNKTGEMNLNGKRGKRVGELAAFRYKELTGQKLTF